MANDMTLIMTNVQPQAFAFDPADADAGTASFLDDGAQFFDQLSAALFDAPPADVLDANAMPTLTMTDAPTPAMLQSRRNAAQAGQVQCRGFAAGVTLQTDKGQKLVQDICAGDRILTRDHGFRPVVWVGQRAVSLTAQVADPALCPVVIAAGALGPSMPDRAMQLSPDQGLMVEGPRTKLLFGTKEVLVPASHLVGYPGIDRAPLAPVVYHYLMCAAHEVIWADSIWTESFQAADPATVNLDPAQRDTLAAALVQNGLPASGQTAARRTLLRSEADLLLA